jgi:hypothetical protein
MSISFSWRYADMADYEFYWRDPIKGYQCIGKLPERRKNRGRITEESVFHWGEKYFCKDLNVSDIFFLEVDINGKAIYTL